MALVPPCKSAHYPMCSGACNVMAFQYSAAAEERRDKRKKKKQREFIFGNSMGLYGGSCRKYGFWAFAYKAPEYFIEQE
jgi:hypothetical protein